MQQVVEVLALGCDMECSLIPLRGGHGDGPILHPLLSKMGLFLCSWVFLDSHYAGRRVTGCRRWQRRSSPIAKNTGVECECISTIFGPAERTTKIKQRVICLYKTLYVKIRLIYSLQIQHHTHASLSSPLRGHIAVARCARRPICGHRDLVWGNRRW